MCPVQTKVPPYPADYIGHVRNTPEECQFGDGLDGEAWNERMHVSEIARGVFGCLLFDPLEERKEPSPYDDFIFMIEERTFNGEWKGFYIRIDPAWLSEVLSAQSEYVDPPEYEEFQIEGLLLFGNLHWNAEKNAYLARLLPAALGREVLADTKEEAKVKLKKAAEEWLSYTDEEAELPLPPPILG